MALAIVVVMWSLGFRASALLSYLSTVAYLRPGEAHRLLCEDLAAPVGGRQLGIQSYTITIAPEERLEVSKTGVSDDTIVLDHPLWLGVLLDKHRRGRPPREALFLVPPEVAVQQWRVACTRLRVEAHRYQLRHTGASVDTLCRRRTPLEVMQRGRWATVKSLKRYAKPGALQKVMHRVPPEIREYAATCSQLVQEVLEERSSVALPQFGHLALTNLVR